MNILVTVGMSRWPFDRLLKAIVPLCREHDLFVQTGASGIIPPCPHAAFVPFLELVGRIAAADVVITHAGNTVRLVQRAGKVPIAVARTSAGEMANDHQVIYLRHEAQHGRVIAQWDLSRLSEAVRAHASIEARLKSERKLDQPADPVRLAAALDAEWRCVSENPFKRHPLRRYAYAWEELATTTGRHLDIGCGTGEFLASLSATTALECHGIDPHPDNLRQAERCCPRIPIRFVQPAGPLPYEANSFTSVSLLDVLEHCPSEDAMLREIARVLAPGGRLILTVPARHAFSWLDPDNAKFRWPAVHRAIYSLRFGRETYRKRFVDCPNGLFGDMSPGKHEHTNYQPGWLVERLEAHGFTIARKTGANLFWRFFHVPSLLGGQRLRGVLDRAIWLDGELFQRANLFITARKRS